MPSHVTYRTATASDLETIAEVHTRSWQTAYRGILSDDFLDRRALADRLSLWRDRFAAPRPRQFVELALAGRVTAGFVCAIGAEDPMHGSLIDNLHVLAEHRSSGIGRVLLEHAAAWLDARHPAVGVHLWVYEANARARAFYARLGGRHVVTEAYENAEGGRAPICLMEWPRPAALLERARA
jgi:GNAT superfamily N-acetyltransferase